jgi:hypothetical protein
LIPEIENWKFWALANTKDPNFEKFFTYTRVLVLWLPVRAIMQSPLGPDFEQVGSHKPHKLITNAQYLTLYCSLQVT